MLRMEIDSPSESVAPSHYDLIIQRLSQLGIPDVSLNQGQRGLVAFAKSNRLHIQELVSAILPADEEEVDEGVFRESMIWLKWLMFEGDPEAALEHLAEMSANQRGVCGAVWGNNDIAYRCRTCQHDPTCAICVPCFENGNHKDHDYSVIYTGGGCCDCGDITAWKREGFCSMHKGAEQIQPLPKHIANSLGPVLDLLLTYWKDELLLAESVSEESPRDVGHAAEPRKTADKLTSAVVEMLLDFCKHSESLLSFISQRVYSSAGLLDILLRAERFMNMNGSVVEKLNELLLKMLGEPIFKYEFAKVFVLYYPTIVNAAVREGSDATFKKYPLLSTFSVQLLTVPTLTPRLVEEMNLLDVLLECLGNIFSSCAGEGGRLQVAKWANLYETTIRVVEDIRFVMSHSAVPKYLCHRRRDLVRTWMRLLASVQGMNTQKRETGSHIEDENENVHLPFVLCHSISNILTLLVAGAFSVSINDDTSEETFFSMYKLDCEDQDSLRHAKVGRLSQESSVSSITGKSSLDLEAKSADSSPMPASALWLMYECLRSIENWLGLDNTLGPLSALSLKSSDGSGNNFLALKRTLSRFRRGRYIFKSSTSSDSKPSILRESLNKHCFSPSHGGSNYGVGLECSQPAPGGCDENILEGESTSEVEGLRVLSLSDWPDITYDVSSHEISVHIPLHRLLSMLLRRALKECYGESGSSYVQRSFARAGEFLGQILDGCHPYGFSAFVMEHPLRIRVFCAEVRAGMWRRNGDAPILFSEWYRSVRWSEQGQDLDLFLLQCCAALAPADLYVQRILERFGLSNYLSLTLEQSSEHEPVLVAEMLTLLIQIVKERRYCGLTTAECLQRELVYKLSIGDATRSQLVKSLPRDLSKVDELQEVLDRVAEYSHPSGMTQGMYKLRSMYWKELDLYHPRWNLRDQQIAEERYLRFCNVSALTTQLPRWTEIYPPLRGIAKLATCKTLLQIVRAVLFYAVFNDKLTTSRAPDGVLLTALHLLALALDVCRLHKESGDRLCYVGDVIPILAFASEEICTSKYGDQSMLSLLVLLMRMHEKENAQNFVEAGNFNLASLVSSLIKTFVELEPGCMTKLHKLAPQLASQFSQSILSENTRDKGSASDNEKRKAKSRERQAAIMEKMRAQQSKFLESVNSGGDDDMDDAKSEQEVCDSEVSDDIQESAEVICSLCHDPKSKSPVSFLVLLQKSRLLSFANQGPPSWEQISRSGKEHVSSETTPSVDLSPSSICDGSEKISSSQLEDLVQSAVNDFASIGQPQEVNAFMEFCKARFPSIKNIQLPCVSKDTSERPPSSLTLEEHMYLLIREFQSSLNGSDSQKSNENFSAAGSSKERSSSSEFLLLGKYIAALPEELLDNPSASQSGRSNSDRMKPESSMLHPGYHNIGPSGADGIYVSSCGHAVHQGCLDRYLSSLRERYIRRIVFEGGHIVDPDQGEFLCPVCRGLANSVLPALPGDLRKVPQPPAVPTISSSYSSSPSTSEDMGGSLRLLEALSLLRRAANIAGSDESLKALPTRNARIKPNLEPFIRILCGMYYPGQDKILETGRVSHSLVLWDTLKYTLMSAEIAARSGKSSLSPNYSISALYKELSASSGFILSLLLDVIQNMRTMNSLTVLLRFQGIQLFARSLCHGTYPSEPPNHSSQQQGNMLHILENAEPEVQYPDIQLWRQASEPILARDAFSSFMWLLFCLPWPTLFCKESYLSLVHVFYTVTVTQAIITCRRKRHSTETQLGSRDNLIMDIYQVMGEFQAAVQCFDSYYIDPAYDITDAIRSLTFPYLRRCALLWKLINCSNIMPFSDGFHSWDGSPFETNDWDCTTGTGEELREIEKLEKMFNIPPLDLIVNDEKSRFTALRWLGHFCEVFEAHKSHCVVRCTPAVPFKLMLLPHLYQDLLQRYIKKSCPDCGDVKEEPALCLLCGKLCSPNWKTCCRGSGCQTHAMACGAGIGVFLLIRRTTILLQRSARQAPWPSPYLDAFGEEDVEMHRGKPLFLNEERYAALTHMVASHGLDRSSKCSMLILSSKIMFSSGARTEDLRTVAVFVSRMYRLHKGEYIFGFVELGS
ncbi:E3 ubiquitin-protein ligase PRT6 [Sesamum alatum]|uniref:E3 ubiquitin-protein ligase n=1 Tax=Sesamum alatum TaxID=300844 RepID=A0AAE1YLD6_9LAMI|nr:E3 ubiquitin-protein ligase PRT6 [Sesamum alatum]